MELIFTKRTFALLTFIFLCVGLSAQKKAYTTTSGELIFSEAKISAGGSDVSSILRFSPVFNFQNWVNFDQSDNFGLFIGTSFRNVGFIYDVPNSNLKKKIRTYNFGIPVGIKLGNLNGNFIYAGYELEIPINYKEKTFTNDSKTDKFNTWFSSRTNAFNSSVFVGLTLPHGASIKFKYYLTNFYNKSYSEKDAQGNPVYPYQDLNVNVFYFSLNMFILKGAKFYPH